MCYRWSVDQTADYKPLSQRAFAKILGVSNVQVNRAIKSGRLSKGVRNGQIVDVELAKREWNASEDLGRANLKMLAAAAERRAEPGPEMGPASALKEGAGVFEAAAAQKFWQAKQAELKFKREAGELVPAADLRAEVVSAFTEVKTKLLGIPARAKQQDPELTVVQIALFEGLIREALERLSE